MKLLEPFNNTKLFGLNKFMSELIQLYHSNNLPSKILLSGQKGIGKSTLAYHFINYVLSQNEEFKYDMDNFQINPDNKSFKTIQNKSNLNFILVDVEPEKKNIDIDQIRKMILKLNKSSFNSKPRFILIDNIEFLNINSVNALLKILEEPNQNIHFILINNNKKILSTLLSRCLNFNISLTNKECLDIANKLLDNNLNNIINSDLISYYSTPGYLYNMAKIGENNNYDLSSFNLKKFIKVIIKDQSYKNDYIIKFLLFDLIELYFIRINLSFSSNIYDKYSYFLNRVSELKKFNLDVETLFIEFEEKILNE